MHLLETIICRQCSLPLAVFLQGIAAARSCQVSLLLTRVAWAPFGDVLAPVSPVRYAEYDEGV